MKCTSLFFYLSSLLIIFNNQAADFFLIEHLPQGTKIPVLKLVNLIPMVKDTPIRDAELKDVYVQFVTETPAVNAHIELLGKIQLKTSLPGLKNFGDLDLSVIGKLFSAFGRGAVPIPSTPLAKPIMPEKPAKTEQEWEEEKAIVKQLYQEMEQLYVRGVERERSGIDRPIESVVEEEMKAAAESLPPARQAFVSRYAQAIKNLESLPPNPDIEKLLSNLTAERANLGEPELNLTALTNANKYLKQPEVVTALEQVKTQQKAIQLEALEPKPAIETIAPVTPLNKMYDETIAAIEKFPQNNNTQAILTALRQEREMVALVSSPSSPPTTTPKAIEAAQIFIREQSPYISPKTQFPLSVPSSPEQSFEREVGKNEAIFREQNPISKHTLVSLRTPAGTAGAEKFVLVESPTGKQYLFNAAQVIRSDIPYEQLEQYVAARETRIASQQKPLTPIEVSSAKQQAYDALKTLQQLPKRFQTPEIVKTIAELKAEIARLELPETPPSELPALAKAKLLIADITPFLPVQPTIQPTISPFSTQQVQHFREIAEKAIGIVSSSKLPTIFTQKYKNSSIWVPSSPLATQAAIPVGDRFILLHTNFPIKGFLDSIPLNSLENFGWNISRNTQAWQEFTKKLHKGTPSKEDIEAILPKAMPQTEYEIARSKLIGKIDSLNKIISQRTSQITRVGAALFLALFQNPNYRPFENVQIPDLPAIDIPGIKDIELNNAELGIFLAPPQVFSIWAQGTGRVINIPLFAKVMFSFEKMPIIDPKTGQQATRDNKPLVASNTGVVLQAGLPEAWKFSDSFPNMKDWDRFIIKRAYVYVSTINYIDYSIPTQLMPSASISIANVPGRPTVGMLPGITIRPGLSLYGEINLRKLIPEIFDHLNFAGLETASLYGTISHKPENCQIGIGLPDLVKIENSPFKLGGVWAEIHAKNMATVPGAPALFKPEASIVVALVIQPSPKDETLTFTARASSDEAGGMVAFSMQGFWNNAFGVEGLSIGDLALQLHTDYKALLAGVPISGGGFTGTFKFGTQEDSTIIKIAALYAMVSTGQEMALQGKLDGTLSIWQIIDGCKSLAIRKAQLDKKPTKAVEDNYNKILNNAVAKQLGNVAIRNVEMKVAPSTVRIGEFFIMQGFTAKGELTLLGVTAGMDFNLGQSGLTATGYLSPIKIGDVFSLTGAGMDKQYGTADDAALMSLALNFMKQHFIITGQVKLLGIEQKTDIFIDTEGLNCTISGKIFNLFDASIVLKSRGDITNPDLYFKASMKQEFTKYIVDETIKALRASTQDAVNKLKDAQNEVDKINRNITDLDKQIADRKKRIDELTKIAAQAPKTSPEITKLGLELTGFETARTGAIASRDAAQKILAGSQEAINKFNEAQQEVNKLNATIADFDNQISNRKKRIEDLGRYTLDAIKNAPEITKLGIEIAGLETAKAGTVASRNTATGVLSSLSGTASLISTNQNQINNLNTEIARLDTQIASHKQRIDELSKQFTQGAQTSPEITKLGLELTGLETAKAGAITSRETAKAALEGVKRWIGGASIIVEAFISHTAVPLDIRESTLEASIQDIAKGKLPRFTANIAILGKKLNLDMQLDFSSPEKAQQSANAIAQQILALFK